MYKIKQIATIKKFTTKHTQYQANLRITDYHAVLELETDVKWIENLVTSMKFQSFAQTLDC